MTEYGDVIGVTSIGCKIVSALSGHSDIQTITTSDNLDGSFVVRLGMNDGTMVTIAIQSNYDPAKDPHIT